jgi:HEPN domain-containing protein
MPSKSYAIEWLGLASKNLETADLLFKENHYTDVIGIEIQQALEKIFKALQAYNNVSIEKTHDLVKLLDKTGKFITISLGNRELLEIISDYYMSNRYPGPNYSIPSKQEIANALDLAHKIFIEVKKSIS